MRSFKYIILFVVIVLSFLGGLYFSKLRSGQNTYKVNLASLSYRKIKGDDILLLSSPKQFSGRMMYSTNFSENWDIVPNETIAVKLGLLMLASVYGERIYDDKPYTVALLDSVWVVETSLLPPSLETDSLEMDSDIVLQPLVCGGIGHVEINKHTGKIYTIYHTK